MDPFDKFLGEFKEFMEKTPQEEIDRRWVLAASGHQGGLTVGDLMKHEVVVTLS